jgi:hypothetical protein
VSTPLPDQVDVAEFDVLSDRVGDLARDLRVLRAEVRDVRRAIPPRVRVERCDGMCPGDDCRACQATADLTTRVRALERQRERRRPAGAVRAGRRPTHHLKARTP